MSPTPSTPLPASPHHPNPNPTSENSAVIIIPTASEKPPSSLSASPPIDAVAVATDDVERQQQQQHLPKCHPRLQGEQEQQIDGERVSSGGALAMFKSLSFLDRFLAVWIFLAMLVGILLGNFVDGVGPALQRGKFVEVSVPIAIGLLVMMYPILCKVQYEKLHEIFRSREVWKQLGFSVVVNWIVAPLIMLGLAWAFLPDERGLREGLILVGIARCIAMVLIWNSLAGGNSDYCAILVAVNSLLQIVLFAPLSLLFLDVFSPSYSTTTTTTATISYSTVATSVAVFLGIPLAAAVLTRLTLLSLAGPRFYHDTFIPIVSPLSLIGLLFTILVLFASQGRRVVRQVVSVVRVSAPLVVYFGLVFFVTLLVARRMGFGRAYAVTQSFTAASNNFELAIAVAVAAFGPDSDQALAATVGPLVEVPVLVGLVYVVNWLSAW